MKIILYSFFILSSILVNAQEKAISWDYPIKPGTEAWKSFETHQQMTDACQIPTKILKSISTEELVSLCLNYPLKTDFFAYNNLLEGVQKVALEFNGLQELFSRKDNAMYLLKQIQKTEINDTLSTMKTDHLKGEFVVKQSLVEVFISIDSVIKHLDKNQKKMLADISMKNMDTKVHSKKHFSRYSIESSTYLLAKVLNSLNQSHKKSTEYEFLLKSGSIINAEVINEIKTTYSDIVIEKEEK